jgi:hypothetical protein
MIEDEVKWLFCTLYLFFTVVTTLLQKTKKKYIWPKSSFHYYLINGTCIGTIVKKKNNWMHLPSEYKFIQINMEVGILGFTTNTRH